MRITLLFISCMFGENESFHALLSNFRHGRGNTASQAFCFVLAARRKIETSARFCPPLNTHKGACRFRCIESAAAGRMDKRNRSPLRRAEYLLENKRGEPTKTCCAQSKGGWLYLQKEVSPINISADCFKAFSAAWRSRAAAAQK